MGLPGTIETNEMGEFQIREILNQLLTLAVANDVHAIAITVTK